MPRRLDNTAVLALVSAVLALFPGCLTGCAGERAAFEVAKQSGALMTTIAQHSPLDKVDLKAKGRLQDPHYRGNVFWVTGVAVDIGLDGAYIEGEANGVGEGFEKLTPEQQKELLKKAQETFPADDLVRAATEALRRQTSQPASK